MSLLRIEMREFVSPKRKRGRNLFRMRFGVKSRILKKVGAFGFACKLVMGYGCGIFGTTLIPQHEQTHGDVGAQDHGPALPLPSNGNGGRQVTEGIPS
jgi:hypothetical protein